MHDPAERGVEHPGRDLLVAADAGVHEGAAYKPAPRPLYDLMEVYRLPGPRMPGVSDHGAVVERGTVGVLW
jgi:hypothetical protein